MDRRKSLVLTKMLDKGRSGGKRILSRLSVELMTTDQLTPEQKAASGFSPGFMTQRLWNSPVPPPVHVDFWASVYQAIDD